MPLHSPAERQAHPGTLIASGLIAGGALFGVFAALTRFAGFEYQSTMDVITNQWLGVIAYAAIIIYLAIQSLNARKG